ncbi:MAG: SDR family oxidoreductase [Bryobacterales bacterium]|nr:SDR family oxidoreductase [Bryobacterales bacterium]
MQNKSTVIVTGASSGIGLALTKTFLAEGYSVVANSRKVKEAGTLTESPRLKLVSGDVADPATARDLVATAVETFGGVDVLINNAGVFVAKAFHEYTDDDYRQLLGTNVSGFFHVTQQVVRQMRQQQRGHVLTITTSLVEQPVAGVSAALTSLTKGGLNAVTKELAIEYASDGIRFNAIAPGIVDTPMHRPEQHEWLAGLHPIRRLAEVDEIADAALYLVRAQFVTGEVLHVDGGAHAGKW